MSTTPKPTTEKKLGFVGRAKKRIAERKSKKLGNQFLRATELGMVTMYIPAARPDTVAIKVMTEEYKDEAPIMVDRLQLAQFMILPGDAKRAKKIKDKEEKK